MEHLTHTLERLAMTFTVRDIMVPKEDLVCAPNEDLARQVLPEHPEFDRIPIMENGRIKGYFDRHSQLIHPIDLEDLVSDATSILDLLVSLQRREFCFVLSKDDISGYAHFSDLNNPIVKVPFYFIIEAVERNLFQTVSPHIDEDNLGLILTKDRVNRVKSKMRKMKENRADLGWTPSLYFSELIHFACHFKTVELNCEEAETIIEVRNLIAHADNPLVEQHSDLKRLSEAKKICLSLLVESVS